MKREGKREKFELMFSLKSSSFVPFYALFTRFLMA